MADFAGYPLLRGFEFSRIVSQTDSRMQNAMHVREAEILIFLPRIIIRGSPNNLKIHNFLFIFYHPYLRHPKPYRSHHTEAIRVIYDPTKVTYAELVEYFWRHIDPTVKDRQFCDVGSQYRSGIYWQNETEKKIVEASLATLKKSGRFPAIHTEIAPATTFWLAEDYHQDYYKKNPLRYSFYRQSCGRDARVQQIWGTVSH